MVSILPKFIFTNFYVFLEVWSLYAPNTKSFLYLLRSCILHLLELGKSMILSKIKQDSTQTNQTQRVKSLQICKAARHKFMCIKDIPNRNGTILPIMSSKRWTESVYLRHDFITRVNEWICKWNLGSPVNTKNNISLLETLKSIHSIWTRGEFQECKASIHSHIIAVFN